MRMRRRLAECTWPELCERPVILVPLGSTEQHGPHLPLETDTVIASAVADELAASVEGYVAPAVSIGASGEHQGFPGVLSIGNEALTTVLIELARSVSPWSERIVLVNGHGGNTASVKRAVDQLIAERHDISWVACLAPGDAHAGRTETSLMMHLAPSLVRGDRVEPGNTRPIGELMPALMTNGVKHLAPNGVLGDPTGASAKEGAQLFANMVETASRGL
jgi:mycofactocin system creatininase family protein